MNEKNLTQIQNVIFFNYKEKWNHEFAGKWMEVIISKEVIHTWKEYSMFSFTCRSWILIFVYVYIEMCWRILKLEHIIRGRKVLKGEVGIYVTWKQTGVPGGNILAKGQGWERWVDREDNQQNGCKNAIMMPFSCILIIKEYFKVNLINLLSTDILPADWKGHLFCIFFWMKIKHAPVSHRGFLIISVCRVA